MSTFKNNRNLTIHFFKHLLLQKLSKPFHWSLKMSSTQVFETESPAIDSSRTTIVLVDKLESVTLFYNWLKTKSAVDR